MGFAVTVVEDACRSVGLGDFVDETFRALAERGIPRVATDDRKSRQCLADDPVRIEPVCTRFSCKQGYYREIGGFCAAAWNASRKCLIFAGIDWV